MPASASFFSKVRSVVCAILCAILLCHFVWRIHPTSISDWAQLYPASVVEAEWLSGFIIRASITAPAILSIWAIVTLGRWTIPAYRIARMLILLHLAAALVVGLSAHLGLTNAFIHPGVELPAFVGAISDAVILALSPFEYRREIVRLFRRYTVITVGGTLLGLLAWSFGNIGIVVARAASFAADRPYCLQIARNHRGGYRAVTGLSDLQGLKMRTPFTRTSGSQDYQFSFHAVLAVEGRQGIEWRNWSYKHQTFTPISTQSVKLLGVRLSCAPQGDFAGGLPLIAK